MMNGFLVLILIRRSSSLARGSGCFTSSTVNPLWKSADPFSLVLSLSFDFVDTSTRIYDSGQQHSRSLLLYNTPTSATTVLQLRVNDKTEHEIPMQKLRKARLAIERVILKL